MFQTTSGSFLISYHNESNNSRMFRLTTSLLKFKTCTRFCGFGKLIWFSLLLLQYLRAGSRCEDSVSAKKDVWIRYVCLS